VRNEHAPAQLCGGGPQQQPSGSGNGSQTPRCAGTSGCGCHPPHLATATIAGVFLTIFINYIDRTNLAFASVQMNEELGFSSTLYGLGAGIFFLV